MLVSLLPQMRIFILVLFSLIFVASAAPVESDDLTMTNFASTTGKGMW
jgi:hypothetical protein